ncbi:Splicing factor 1 [Tritrichomonas musculus]|uniref:Splicing factor 1 n=1 Tax=Tritrichomonas musculus TaxID=1915356 RepID=A0ABR2K326_9EUKA
MSDSDDEYPDKKPYFVPFCKKNTHWGDPAHHPHIPNVAYVLSPDLQGTPLRLALLRMQIEENAFQIEHMEEEATYAIWKENFIDTETWDNKIPFAVKEKARDILAREMKSTITAFDQEFPSILKRPAHPQSYSNYHLYEPNEYPKQNPSNPVQSNDFLFESSDTIESSKQ